jgi:hypothetical protein
MQVGRIEDIAQRAGEIVAPIGLGSRRTPAMASPLSCSRASGKPDVSSTWGSLQTLMWPPDCLRKPNTC